MTRKERAALAAEARGQTDGGRYVDERPGLTADSPKSAVEAWLQWCDPNGCHLSAKGSRGPAGDDWNGEGYESADDAWDALRGMLADGRDASLT